MRNPATAPLNSRPARERVLLAAHDLFYRNGVRATGIDRVIAESGVTKATFYRHFPSKNELVIAFLEYRHRRWMDWFDEALARHAGTHGGRVAEAVVSALAEWFESGNFRGCAFINSVAELGGALPEVNKIARRHKREMTEAIAHRLPDSGNREEDAQAIALAVDGAIIRAQIDERAEPALEALCRSIRAVLDAGSGASTA